MDIAVCLLRQVQSCLSSSYWLSLLLASLPRPVALHLDLLLRVLLRILHHVASDGLVLSLECHASQVRVKLG